MSSKSINTASAQTTTVQSASYDRLNGTWQYVIVGAAGATKSCNEEQFSHIASQLSKQERRQLVRSEHVAYWQYRKDHPDPYGLTKEDAKLLLCYAAAVVGGCVGFGLVMFFTSH